MTRVRPLLFMSRATLRSGTFDRSALIRLFSTHFKKQAPKNIAGRSAVPKPSSIERVLARIEGKLLKVDKTVQSNQKEIRAVVEHSNESRRLWKPETVEHMQQKVQRIDQFLRSSFNYTPYGIRIFNPLAIAGGTAVLVAVFLSRRQHIYQTVAEESASLGKHVLSQNSRNLVETIEAVSKDPETLAALQGLLVTALKTESTRAALLQLLVSVFQDEELCNTTGVFLLESLNTSTTMAMLNKQTAALVTATVQDEQVQAARSCLHYLPSHPPSFLFPLSICPQGPIFFIIYS